MQYVVLRSGGKQYKVSVGDVLRIDQLDKEAGRSVVFDDILLFVEDGKAMIGKPSISGASVEAKLVENVKGDKIRVSKFKAKSRYRKTVGFRPVLSVVKIEKISTKTASRAKK